MMPSVIRHTEQRGKGRLQDGQAVAPFAVLPPRDSLIILLQKLQRIRIWGGTS